MFCNLPFLKFVQSLLHGMESADSVISVSYT